MKTRVTLYNDPMSTQPDANLPEKSFGFTYLRAGAGLLVILLILFCAVQTGRLMLSYAAVQTGANRAAAFAVSGVLTAQKIPSYQDCATIRQAVGQTGWMGAFDENDIEILYVPSGSNCPYGQPGDRSLEVRIHGRFLFIPLVRILPLPLTASQALIITPAASLPAGDNLPQPALPQSSPFAPDPQGPAPANPEQVTTPLPGSSLPTGTAAAGPLSPADPGNFDPPDPESAGEFYSTPIGQGNKTPGAANPTATFPGFSQPTRTLTPQPTQTRQPCTVPIESGGCP